MGNFYSVSVKKTKKVSYRLDFVVESLLEKEQIEKEFASVKVRSGLRQEIEDHADGFSDDDWEEDFIDELEIDVDGFGEGIQVCNEAPDDTDYLIEYKNNLKDLKDAELDAKDKEIAELKKKLEEKK